MKKQALFSIFFTLFVSLCFGQAVLQGSIKDEAAQPVRGALIRILNTSFETLSGANGNFVFSNLPAGTYTILGSAEGRGESIKTVAVEKGTTTIDLVLPQSTNQLESIVVSSHKREEILQQTPVSIRALSAQKVAEYRLWNISDLTAVASNLYAAHPGDLRNVTSIRGVVNTSYDPAVATYVDGVNQFNLDTYIPQLFDVERIEVLKGPQGTLYGRNAMGGVVNIITRRPGNFTDGFANVSIGNYNQQRYTAGVRTPLVKDKLFLGVAGLYDRTNGIYTNEFNNSPYDKRSSAIGNYYLRFTPTASWALTLNAKHSHNRNNGAFPLVFGVEEAFKNPFRLNQNAITKMVDNSLNTSLTVQHYGRSVQLSSQTAYQTNHRYYTDPIDADFSPLDAVSIINNYGDAWNKVKVFTQEINLQSAAAKSSAFKWLAGAFFFHQDNPVKQATHFGSQADLLGAPDVNFSLLNTSTAKGTGAAVYGQVSYAFSPKMELTAGLRYDREKRKQQILGEYLKDPNPTPLFAYQTDTSASANFSAFSPKLTLAWHPEEQQTVYASYSRGFRAGGLTPLSSEPSQPALYPFKPEFSSNIEAGWKQTLWQQKMILNLALFYTTITDVQVPTLVLPAAVTITKNTGKLVSKGIEAELRALPLKGLRIDYDFGYTNAEYNQLQISQGGNVIDLKGKKQLFTPDVTSMLAAQYTHFFGPNSPSVVLRSEWKYLGTQYFDLTNTIRQSSYHLLNARVGAVYRKAELFFWGRNLTDQRYIAFAYDFGAVHLGDPKTYGVSLGYRF